MLLYFKSFNFYSITVPPAVSALSEQTATISENLEATIDMSNLMLKYIPTDTLFYRNMSFMQKALFFASALNKGSYAFNGFGHTITVDDFFEAEEAEPPRKKALVVKSVPLAAGKKPQVASKVAKKLSLLLAQRQEHLVTLLMSQVKERNRGMIVNQKVNQRMSFILL